MNEKSSNDPKSLAFEFITNPKLIDRLDNIIITPHALCWTDECFNDIATEAINSILNFIDKKPISNQVNK